jgi:hypothetical protein
MLDAVLLCWYLYPEDGGSDLKVEAVLRRWQQCPEGGDSALTREENVSPKHS